MSALLVIRNLSISYLSRQGKVRANRNISLDLEAGQTLALIGESGCGKSTLALGLLRLLPDNALISGEIRFKDIELLGLDAESMRPLLGREMALIPQDSGACLNPVLRSGRQLAEALQLHRLLTAREARKQAMSVFEDLQLPQPERSFGYYPHQLSGGMKQRILAALGLAGKPSLLIADEPTRGLDAVARFEAAENLMNFSRETDLAILLITHDLRLACRLSDKIAVMYAGEIVELGSSMEVLKEPRHPYTAALLASLPGPAMKAIPGGSPDLMNIAPGCSFFPRCSRARKECALKAPIWQAVSGRQVRCNFFVKGEEPGENLLPEGIREGFI